MSNRELSSPITVVITLAGMGAAAALTAGGPATVETVTREPVHALAFLTLALALQLCSVTVYGRGSISVSGIGILAAGFSLGPGAAAAVAFLVALAQWLRRRGLLHRAIFDAANLSLSAGGASLLFHALTSANGSAATKVAAATAAGAAYTASSTALLCLAMSLTENTGPAEIWRERFRWLTPHYLAFGPLALASTFAYDHVGVTGLLVFALPPGLMVVSVRQYLERTTESVEEVRQANEQLRLANESLAARNRDLGDLFQLAGGLAARAHDRVELVAYAERRVGAMTGATARIRIGAGSGGLALAVGGHQVGSLSLVSGDDFDQERWERLREAVLPHLATAVESTELVEKVRRTHLATIAALSRSIEAKDYYTGGHTERVAALAVGLAGRLGFSAADLDAIEVGALLHDIGKIGIPERILHKPSPLDPDEWPIMKRHPLVSEQILAEIDLPPAVREIARWSHERIDGLGYPDGLARDEIPLPARIVLVADAFDAMTTDRPYRSRRSVTEALAEIRAHTGTQFCPRVVEALDAIHREEPTLLGDVHLHVVDVA